MKSYQDCLEIIRSLDYSHTYTTDAEHCVQLFDVGLSQHPKIVVELGSYRGISTIALACLKNFFDVEIISVDLCDEIHSDYRQCYWHGHGIRDIASVDMPCMEYLKEADDKSIDYVFHDAAHGDGQIPEYLEAWRTVSTNGVLAIHDVDALSNHNDFISQLTEIRHYCISEDSRGRILGFFFKS